MEKASILTTLFVFLFIVRKSLSVDCYICGTITALEPACEDPFNPESMFKFACRGSCAKYKGETSDVQVVWRTCLQQRLPDTCEHQTQLGVKVNVCYCNVDKCNAATTSRQSNANTIAFTLTFLHVLMSCLMTTT